MNELLAFLSDHYLAGIFLVTVAARAGVPVPAAPLIVVAGALARSDQLSLALVTATSTLANVVGDSVWFMAGRLWGHRVLRALCRVSLSPDGCVRRSEDLILRWGGTSLVAAKFVPGISVMAAPMAGALAMPWPRFLGYDVLASATWTLVFLGIGLMFGASIQGVLATLAGGGLLGAIAISCLLLAFLGYRWHRRRATSSLAKMSTSCGCDADLPRIHQPRRNSTPLER